MYKNGRTLQIFNAYFESGLKLFLSPINFQWIENGILTDLKTQ
jgi:hypothetical protein